jgi:hypothetical protein
MNRIHALAQHPDGVFAIPAADSEIASPLHLCPVNGRIVDCVENCPDCAAISARLEADFHAHVQSQAFGLAEAGLRPQPAGQIDAGVDTHYARGMLIWFLDRTEHWPAWFFWSVCSLTVCIFWSIAFWFMTWHG